MDFSSSLIIWLNTGSTSVSAKNPRGALHQDCHAGPFSVAGGFRTGLAHTFVKAAQST
jgi:hypothetical protein